MNNETIVEERIKALKEHLLNTYVDDSFKANSNTFLNVLNMGSNNIYYIKKLMEEGFIKCIHPAERIAGKWMLAEYEIPSIIENSKENKSKIDVNDYIEENFNNIPVRLIKTQKGYVIPLNDVCDGIGLNRVAARQMIERNIELFKDFQGSCVIQSPSGKQETIVLTKDGIIGLLFKISVTKIAEDKKKRVIDFQKWAINKLGILISDGKVELTEQEHAKIQTDISTITNISEEDMDKMFNDLKDVIDIKLLKVKSILKEKDSEINRARIERNNAIQREKLTISKVPQMVEQRINLLLNI